jgi:hypothetical protein
MVERRGKSIAEQRLENHVPATANSQARAHNNNRGTVQYGDFYPSLLAVIKRELIRAFEVELARASSNCKRQNRPLVKESAPYQETRNCLTVIKIWS